MTGEIHVIPARTASPWIAGSLLALVRLLAVPLWRSLEVNRDTGKRFDVPFGPIVRRLENDSIPFAADQDRVPFEVKLFR
jgi:hypothetical protein